MMGYNIVFIGAGNLGVHLAKALYDSGNHIAQVFSRTGNSACYLADQVNAIYTTDTASVVDADIYIIAVKDSVYHELLPHIDFNNKLLVHCSGSIALSVLKDHSSNYGVLYPLQTFSKDRKLEFRKIPVFVEANNLENEDVLKELANGISDHVLHLESDKRLFLHISAVFACNFVNHFYTLAAEILKSKEIPFHVLLPLIEETAAKVESMAPHMAQTGPAVRYDENIIKKHEKALRESGNYEYLYHIVSKSIYNYYQNED